MVHHPAPESIYSRPIKSKEHASDVARLEIMIRYGGMYFDLDVVVVKPFTDLFQYETTLGREGGEGIGNGIIISHCSSIFLWLWYISYQHFNDSKWNEQSIEFTHKLDKMYPGLVHVEEKSLQYPRSPYLKFIYGEGMFHEWKTKNYAIHLYYRQYNKEHNPEDIKHLNTTMGQIFRYTYYGTSDFVT